MPDMIVTSRVCRYNDHEYKRDETITDVAPNHARVLVTLGKAKLKTGPVGHVGSTAPAPAASVAALAGDPEPETAAEAAVEPEPVRELPADPAPAAPRRGRYRNRALRSDAD